MKTVYRVVHSYYDDYGIDSTWEREEDARTRLKQLQDIGPGGDYWYRKHGDVEEEDVYESREEFEKLMHGGDCT